MALAAQPTPLTPLLIVFAALLGLEFTTAELLKVQYFGGKLQGCYETTDSLVHVYGDPVPLEDFARHAQVCLGAGKKYSPYLHFGNIKFKGSKGYSDFTIYTGVSKEAEALAFYNRDTDDFVLNLGSAFQMVVRDCALFVIYDAGQLPHDVTTMLGLSPTGTFQYPDPKLECCGGGCLDGSCREPEGYEGGLKATFYPRPPWKCGREGRESGYRHRMPEEGFWRSPRGVDPGMSHRCQKDLNVFEYGEAWEGWPRLAPHYAAGCFAVRMSGEVRLPAAPAEHCHRSGHARSYQVCVEHDDFLHLSIGDDLFEYSSTEPAARGHTAYKSCRPLTIRGNPDGDIWLPMHLRYAGSPYDKFSELRLWVLPLISCAREGYRHEEERPLFCEPCDGRNAGTCCEALGPCDLRSWGRCSPGEYEQGRGERDGGEYEVQGEGVSEGYQEVSEEGRTGESSVVEVQGASELGDPELEPGSEYHVSEERVSQRHESRGHKMPEKYVQEDDVVSEQHVPVDEQVREDSDKDYYRRPARPSCVVGSKGGCAACVEGDGFYEDGELVGEKTQHFPMCCLHPPRVPRWGPRAITPVVWSVANVTYEPPSSGAWLSFPRNSGEVGFDHYGKPDCRYSKLEVTYSPSDLPVGVYHAKVHINSQDKSVGEYDGDTDALVEVHLVVSETPKVTFEKAELNYDRNKIDVVAKIDGSGGHFRIPKDELHIIAESQSYIGGEHGSGIADVTDRYHDLFVEASVDPKDPFVCQKNSISLGGLAFVKGKWAACGSLPVRGAVEVCYPPTCRFYSVDGSFVGGQGLVTDRYKAQFVLVCTQEAAVCKDCFAVKGPHYYSVSHFSKVQGSPASYMLSVEWDKDYYGPVWVGINAEARYLETCSLDLLEPYRCEGTAEYGKIQVVEPIEIVRVKAATVRPLSYTLNGDCDGQHCYQVAPEQEHADVEEAEGPLHPGAAGEMEHTHPHDGAPYEEAPGHGKPHGASSHGGHQGDRENGYASGYGGVYRNEHDRGYGGDYVKGYQSGQVARREEWVRPDPRDQGRERGYETPYIRYADAEAAAYGRSGGHYGYVG